MSLVDPVSNTLRPWVILGVLVAWLSSLVAVGVWQRADGARAERVDFQATENAELRAANAKINELTSTALKNQAEHDTTLADLATHYEGEMSDEKTKHEAAIAAVRRGYRLHDSGAKCPSGSAAGTAVTASGGGDGQTEAELSGEASEFLLGEASRANEVVHQLELCQAVVIEDRRLCGANQGEQ